MNPAEFVNIATLEERFWWYRGMQRILSTVLDPVVAESPVHRMLEAGCGTGAIARFLRNRYGCDVYPIDLGWEGLQYARRAGVPRLVQANLLSLPFADGFFDALISLDVIVHLPHGEEAAAIRELTRVLAPGGLFVIRVSALNALRSRHSEFAHERQRFTSLRLLRLLREHNIRVLRSTYINALLLPVAWFKFRVWEPLTRQPAASGIAPLPEWLNRLLERALLAEATWLRNGRGFPLGQSLLVVGRKA